MSLRFVPLASFVLLASTACGSAAATPTDLTAWAVDGITDLALNADQDAGAHSCVSETVHVANLGVNAVVLTRVDLDEIWFTPEGQDARPYFRAFHTDGSVLVDAGGDANLNVTFCTDAAGMLGSFRLRDGSAWCTDIVNVSFQGTIYLEGVDSAGEEIGETGSVAASVAGSLHCCGGAFLAC